MTLKFYSPKLSQLKEQRQQHHTTTLPVEEGNTEASKWTTETPQRQVSVEGARVQCISLFEKTHNNLGCSLTWVHGHSEREQLPG